MATITAYHGTNEVFNEFNFQHLGLNTDGNATDASYAQTARLGLWFNTGGNLSFYDRVMECGLELENTLEGGTLETIANWIESQEMSGEELREKLLSEGYDSIRIQDEEMGGTSWCVLDLAKINIL